MKIKMLLKYKSLKRAQELKPMGRNKIIQETETEVITKSGEKGKYPKTSPDQVPQCSRHSIKNSIVKKAKSENVLNEQRDAEDHCSLEQWRRTVF